MSAAKWARRFGWFGATVAAVASVPALSYRQYWKRQSEEASYATFVLKSTRWIRASVHPARFLLRDIAGLCAFDESTANLLLCDIPRASLSEFQASPDVWLRAVANGSAVSERVRALVRGRWRDDVMRVVRSGASSTDRELLCALVALANAGAPLDDVRQCVERDADLLRRLSDVQRPLLQEQLSRVAPLLAVDALLESSEPIVHRNVAAALAARSLDLLGTDKYADGLYLLHNDADAAFDIVLIHGVTGDAYGTWVQLNHNDVVWPRDWLPNDVKRIRVLSVGFELFLSRWWGNALPLKERARSISGLLRMAGVGKRPVIFLTHSFGGLLAKEIIASGQVQNVAGVVFFSTPHRGADLVWLMDAMPTVTRGTTAAQELLPDSGQLAQLQAGFMKTGIPSLSIGEGETCGYPTRFNCVQVVSDESARLCDECQFVKLSYSDHHSINKPDSRTDRRYTEALAFIRSIISRAAHSPSASNMR
jgi:hypothetical protein